jgi:hypothetical protein
LKVEGFAMLFNSLLDVLKSAAGRSRHTRPHRRRGRAGPASPRRSLLPRLEALEDRSVPSTVGSLLDNGASDTLRAVLASAPAGDTITFAPSLVNQTITLTQGELYINRPLSIVGPAGGHLTISGNHASRVFEVGYGERVALSGLTIADGQTPGYQAGGGVLNHGTLFVTNCTLAGNSAIGGGGIENAKDIDNTATLIMTGCTLTGNYGKFGGGGLGNSGTAWLTNCTIAGNSAGLNAGALDNSGWAKLTNCTIAGNTSQSGVGGVRNDCLDGGQLLIGNTIIAGNIGYDGGSDVSNVITSLGYNLIQYPQYGKGYAASDLLGVDPLLDPNGLQDNGGPTQTIALRSGSQAINYGSNPLAVDPWGNPLTTDQRGLSRPTFGGVDIGAYQTQPSSSGSYGGGGGACPMPWDYAHQYPQTYNGGRGPIHVNYMM